MTVCNSDRKNNRSIAASISSTESNCVFCIEPNPETDLNDTITRAMRKRDRNDVGIQREAGDGSLRFIDGCEQIVAAANEGEKSAMGVCFDEQATHGGGEVAAAMQTDEAIIGRVYAHTFTGVLIGGKEEVFQVASFQTFEDVVGDHVEVVCCFLTIHLLNQLRLRFHTDHRVLILSGEKLEWMSTAKRTSDM